MKKFYTNPEVDVVVFENNTIITTSFGSDINTDTSGEEDGDDML